MASSSSYVALWSARVTKEPLLPSRARDCCSHLRVWPTFETFSGLLELSDEAGEELGRISSSMGPRHVTSPGQVQDLSSCNAG